MNRALVMLLALIAIVACSSDPAPSNEESLDTETVRYQIRKVKYPYVGEYGETVCASYDGLDGNNEIVESLDEYYYMDKIQELLSKKPRLKKKLASLKQCNLAREFLKQELDEEESGPSVQDLPLPAPNDIVVNNEDVVNSNNLVPGLKPLIKNGASFAYSPSVYVRVWQNGTSAPSRCSASLIGPKHLLLAAHCLQTASGRKRVTVQHFDKSCIFPEGSDNDCKTIPDSANAQVDQHWNFAGVSDAAYDIAIIKVDDPFSKGNFMRIAESKIPVGHYPWWLGWGYSDQGVGLGTARIGDLATHVDWSGYHYWYAEQTASQPALCEGDSGGASVSTTAVVGYDLLVGIHSNRDYESVAGQSPPHCTQPSYRQRDVHPGAHVLWIEDRMFFTCQRYVTSQDSFYFRKCW